MTAGPERLFEMPDPWRSGLIDAATQEAIIHAVGDLLRQARLARGLKLGVLAARCGVSGSVLSRVELARRKPAVSLLMTVCGNLGIRVSDLFRAAEDAAVPPIPAVSRDGNFRDLLG